jgi:small subunit ribosomal protein S13
VGAAVPFIENSLQRVVCKFKITPNGGKKMARIAGVDLPNDKRIEIALTYIYGIGTTSASNIIKIAGLNPDTRVKDLTEDEVAKIRETIERENVVVEGDLKRQVAGDIKRLTDINCYRGRRHRLGLPVHGQRTKTNARTRKGPKHTVAGKKK